MWISSMVGDCIEISNPFIENYKHVIQSVEYIRLRSNARRYLATSLPYQREVGGIVNIVEDISPPPATIKKRGNPIWISSMVGHSIEISNPFIENYKHVIQSVGIYDCAAMQGNTLPQVPL